MSNFVYLATGEVLNIDIEKFSNTTTTPSSSNYLDLVGNLKLRGTSIVNGNLIINNNNDKQVAGISKDGDLMIKGSIIFGDDKNNAWKLSADGDNFLFQKSGGQGINITNKGVITTASVLNNNSWSFPNFL
jgi:hypothetical protein